MFIHWKCVFDTGERPFAPGVDQEPRRPLRMVIGDTVTIRASLITPAGAPFVLLAGEHLAWTIRAVGLPSRRILTKQSSEVSPGGGLYEIALTTAETRILPAGRAIHDLFAIRGPARSVVIPTSELVIATSSLGGP